MKKLIFVGGTMGVGKSTTCKQLAKQLNHSVFLDGDWCWDMHPFVVNEETKAMVLDNITHVLQNFINCSAYEYVIFGWVMHEQAIIEELLNRLQLEEVDVETYSLVCDKTALSERIRKDIDQGLRNVDGLHRSLQRLACYERLDTIKIDTTQKNIEDVVDILYKQCK